MCTLFIGESIEVCLQLDSDKKKMWIRILFYKQCDKNEACNANYRALPKCFNLGQLWTWTLQISNNDIQASVFTY